MRFHSLSVFTFLAFFLDDRTHEAVAVKENHCKQCKNYAHDEEAVGDIEYAEKAVYSDEIAHCTAKKFVRFKTVSKSVNGVADCAANNKCKCYLPKNTAGAAAQ